MLLIEIAMLMDQTGWGLLIITCMQAVLHCTVLQAGGLGVFQKHGFYSHDEERGQKIAPMLGNQGQKIALLRTTRAFLPSHSLMEVKMHDPWLSRSDP